MPLQHQIQRINGQTLITVPHQGKTITFVYQRYGPGNYFDVKNSIEKAGLITPTMAELISLVHPIFMSWKEEPEFLEIKKHILKNGWLFGWTGNLAIPKKGVYIQDRPETKSREVLMDEPSLIKKLEAKDITVRFVPFGFYTGEIESRFYRALEKNSYVRALAGEEGAEKLADIVDKFEFKPYLFGFNSVDKPTKTVSTLISYWCSNTIRLDISGYFDGCCKEGPAFGILKQQ